MIVREQGDHWHVVLQPEHPLLSEEVAAAWADKGPRHPSVVTAARLHDDGWGVLERSPQAQMLQARSLYFVGCQLQVSRKAFSL